MTAPRSPIWAIALRIGVLLTGFLALAIGASEAEDLALVASAPTLANLATAAAMTAAVGLATVILVRFVRPRGAVSGWAGFPVRKGWPRDYLRGWILGGASLAAVAGLGIALGAWRPVRVLPADGLLLALIVFGAIAAAVGAFLEEAVFRGALFSELRGRMRDGLALLLIAVPFALLHALNDGFGAPFMIAAVLGSLFFGALRLWLGDLWFAAGWHGAWNFVQYGLLGVATVEAPHGGHAWIQMSRPGSALLTGSGQSIEGGLLAGGMIGLWLIVVVALWARATSGTRQSPSPE